MDLRQLRYFVAVAEELSFSRAATRLNLAQSALSFQIRQLERQLGGPLLTRTTRRAELTPAGAALLADGREILTATERARERARALARGEAGSLALGSVGPIREDILVPLVAGFDSRHPNVRVEVRAFAFTDMVDGLRAGHADCAFHYGPLHDPELVITPLMDEPRVVVLAQSHRLARRKQLRPADLVDELFIEQPATLPKAWRDHWLLVEENGRRPPVSEHTPDKLEDWLHLISGGAGIDTAPSVVSRYFTWPGIRYVPLVDAAPCTLAVARERHNNDLLVAELTEVVTEIVAQAA